MPDENISSAQDAIANDERPTAQRRLLVVAVGLLVLAVALVIYQCDAWHAFFAGTHSVAHAQQESRLGDVRPVSEGFQPKTVIPRAFPAIDDVPIARVEEAREKSRDRNSCWESLLAMRPVPIQSTC